MSDGRYVTAKTIRGTSFEIHSSFTVTSPINCYSLTPTMSLNCLSNSIRINEKNVGGCWEPYLSPHDQYVKHKTIDKIEIPLGVLASREYLFRRCEKYV